MARDNPTTCSNVTVSYCGLAPVWDNAFGFLSLDCPGDSLLFFSTFNDNDCGDGNNLTYIYYNVPAGPTTSPWSSIQATTRWDPIP